MEGPTVENLPRRVGRYDIAARIAGGRSPIGSDVLIATDSLRVGAGGKPVVVKRLAPALTKDAAKAAAYVATAQEVAKRLRHPNVVEIRAVGAEGSDVFLVTDYLPGETLARFTGELHTAGQTLEPTTAAYIVAEACAALAAAHRLGFVHGVLTPYDVFIGYDGTVKVLDIGTAAAKVTLVGEEVMQVRDVEMQYSSPEVCRGQSPEKRSDVFSLGAILWELLTGVSAFERTERAATIRAICDEPIAPPSVTRRDAAIPERLSATTLEALERDLEKRCADAGKLRQLLLAHVGADKPARVELARLMTQTFAKRKADKETLLARLSGESGTKDVGSLDFTDDATGLDAPPHPADLDAKIPSGIAAPTAGSVTAGPSIIVHRPQSDPSLRTIHPVRERAPTMPLGSGLDAAAPDIESPPSEPATSGAPPAPSAKPPYVPAFDDTAAERRARQEATAVLARPKSRAEPIVVVPSAPTRRTPRAIIFGVVVGVALTLAVVTLRNKMREETPAPRSTPVVAAATSSPPPAPAPSASTPPQETASAAPSAAPEKATLSIDTVPTHATVSLNGKKMGTSPIELKIPKSNDEVIVEIQHPGFVTLKERVVPTESQRLKLNLVPAKTTAAAKPSSTVSYKKFE